jgi:tRNA A37 threonylcarbamoyladenosine biosynthesis protein TsaE
MRQVNLFTKSAFQTRKLGKEIAEKILKEELKRKPLLLFLEGELGSGKTAFVQGFAKGLGI